MQASAHLQYMIQLVVEADWLKFIIANFYNLILQKTGKVNRKLCKSEVISYITVLFFYSKFPKVVMLMMATIPICAFDFFSIYINLSSASLLTSLTAVIRLLLAF